MRYKLIVYLILFVFVNKVLHVSYNIGIATKYPKAVKENVHIISWTEHDLLWCINPYPLMKSTPCLLCYGRNR